MGVNSIGGTVFERFYQTLTFEDMDTSLYSNI